MNASELVRRTPELTRERLADWRRQGLVRPNPRSGGGIGHPLEFSPDEVAVIQLMARLHRAGLASDTAHWVARRLAGDDAPEGGEVELGPGIRLTIGQHGPAVPPGTDWRFAGRAAVPASTSDGAP